MSAGDWIKLHRSLMQSDVWPDPWLFQLWVWCLMRANYCDQKWLGKVVRRGQFVTGQSSGAGELNVSPATWYRGMKKLESFGYIELEANSKNTLVTVCKYSTYQDGQCDERIASELPVNSERIAGELPVNTIKEGNNQRREEGREGATEPDPLAHERAIIEVEQPSPKTPWTPPEGINPITVEAVRRWNDFTFATTGRYIPPMTIDAELMARKRQGWTPQKFSDAVDLTIRVNGKRLLDPDKDYQKSERPKSIYPAPKSSNPQLKVS